MPSYFRFLWLAACSAAAFVVVSVSAVLAAQEQPTRSTRDGVFSVAQAQRGEELYHEVCEECHSGRIWGAEWEKMTLADVYDFISVNMPESSPGSLSAGQVRDAIAYILSSNGLPAGGADVPVNYGDLARIRVERPAR